MNKNYLIFVFVIFTLGANSQNCNWDWNISYGGNVGKNSLSNAYGPISDSPELLWSGGISAPYSTPSLIYEDNLIVTRRDPGNSSGEAWIANYNLYTGELLWQVQLPPSGYDRFGYASGVNNGQIYATRSSIGKPATLFALNVVTGETIWETEQTVELNDCAAISFSQEGNIIVGDQAAVNCFDQDDGTLLWNNPNSAIGEASQVAVYENKGYYWSSEAGNVVVEVCDLNTGEKLYSSPYLYDWSMISLQSAPSVGSNGTIYAPLVHGGSVDDTLFSLTDYGDTLNVNWAKQYGSPTRFHPAVDAENNIIYFDIVDGNDEMQLIKIDHETGDILYSTTETFETFTYVAIGADGYIYITNDWPWYTLSIYTPDLQLVWTEAINGVRAPTLGNGALAVVGKNNEIRVYEGRFVPVAIAGDDQQVQSGELIEFDGTNSYDMNQDDVLTYLWEASSEDIVFDDAASATPTCTAPTVTVATEYEIYLTVSDGELTGCQDTLILTVSELTGINNTPKENQISVYPNPSDGIFTIKNLENKNAVIEVLTVTGKIVYSSEVLSSHKSEINVDISNQTEGIYILRYFADDKYHFQKIIKQ